MATKKNTGKTKEERKVRTKEDLLEEFFNRAQNALSMLERRFGIEGVCDQLFGKNSSQAEAKEIFRKSLAWQTMSDIYDYAVNGVVPEGDDDCCTEIDAYDIINFVDTSEDPVSQDWFNIIQMGDCRFGLDEGTAFSLKKLALLANVDIRTVRNAISSGDLIIDNEAVRPSLNPDREIFIDNASARRWLHGRRGFKPTVYQSSEKTQPLESIKTPSEFGVFLTNRRQQLGLQEQGVKLLVLHPSATPKAIEQLEAGIFTLPLDAVFPIADFYQLDRKTFLQCVMRVFFFDEMQMLSETNETGEK